MKQRLWSPLPGFDWVVPLPIQVVSKILLMNSSISMNSLLCRVYALVYPVVFGWTTFATGSLFLDAYTECLYNYASPCLVFKSPPGALLVQMNRSTGLIVLSFFYILGLFFHAVLLFVMILLPTSVAAASVKGN